jgi:hypothetical protein
MSTVVKLFGFSISSKQEKKLENGNLIDTFIKFLIKLYVPFNFCCFSVILSKSKENIEVISQCHVFRAAK